ncbi:MAG: glycosyltransferase family 39 protein [Actinobacteria bacterium]|nr:glycosyltransferase family 39 protein [Actinomycetota bacterium]
MSTHPSAIDRGPVSGISWFLILGGAGLAAGLLGRVDPDAQMYLALTAIVAVVAGFWIPRAVARDPSISRRFLALALLAHVVGALLRFFIIKNVYHGVADANGYYGAGVQLGPEFRALDIPALQPPYYGTPFIDWTTGLLFAFTGPTFLGGFLIHSVLSFVGAWFFYRAFRVSFPEGSHKLFALLIFLLPSMWYWPSSLGKDAVIMLFLGIATYGFAVLLRRSLLKGSAVALIGLAGTFMVRPPMAAALAVAGAAAFVLRPRQARSLQVQALTWIVMVPLLAVVAYSAVGSTLSSVGAESAVEAFESQHSVEFTGGPGGSGSNFSAPTPFSPLGFFTALLTVNFRPFPWEAGGLLPALTAVEGVFLIGLLSWRRREVWRGIWSWRRNGMVLLVVGAFLSLSIILSSLTNFGLLARQRTQVLPYLLMLPCMVRSVRLRREADERTVAART